MPNETPPEGPTATEHIDSATAVRVWLETQGYGLEHHAAAAFARMGFTPRQGLTYQDPVEGKIREVDVVCRAELAAAKVEIQTVVECKRSTSAWVTRTTSAPTMHKGRTRWLPIATATVLDYLVEHPVVLDDVLRLRRPVAFDAVQAHRKDPKAGDPAYAALSQVVSETTGLLADVDLFPNPVLFHPVIVLDGELFRASFGPYPEVRVEQIGRERIHWSGARVPLIIDVVTLPELDSYVQDLRFELGELAESLQQAPGDLRPPLLA
jgi:hypothetical protein